jgi:hypothetical protein
MKIWIEQINKGLGILIIIALVVLPVSLVGQEKTYANVDTLEERVTKLKNSLDLDDDQAAKIREILEKDREQAAKDRESFKTKALDLIQFAYDRRDNTNVEIEQLLNPGQKEEFKESLRMTRFDRELFELTEGLILNDDQAFTVEGILIEYFNKMKEIMPVDTWSEGRIPKEEMRGDPPMPRRGYGRTGGMLKGAGRKKNKRIKRVLTDEQKILFKQILEDREEKRREMRKKMKVTDLARFGDRPEKSLFEILNNLISLAAVGG